MISKGRNYTVFSPKSTKTGKPMCTVMDYDKNNPSAKRYVTIFVQNDIELYDRAKVRIEEITGISLSEYNGKQQVAMFATLSLADVDPIDLAKESTTKIDISSDDLPF